MKNINIIHLLFAFFMLPTVQFAQTALLKTDTIAVPCTSSDTFLVPVKLLNFNNLGGAQFTIEWDNTKSKFIHTQDFNPLLLNGFLNVDSVTHITKSQITFAWLDPNGLTIPNSANTLFKMAFVRIGGAYSQVAFDTTALPNPPPTAVTLSDPNFNPVPFAVSIGGMRTTDPLAPAIGCPASVTLSASGPIPVSNIAPTSLADNCGIDFTGWRSTGATTNNFPNDPNASGAVFNVGTTTVTYTTTDVGGNTATCAFLVNVEFNAAASDTLTFQASSGVANCGQIFFADVTTSNFDSIFGAQFSMQWLTSVLRFDSVGMLSTALNVQQSNFNTAFAQNGNTPGTGNISFGWNSDDFSAGTTVPDGTKMFRLYFTVQGGHGSTTGINFVGFPAALLSITPALTPEPTVYLAGQFSVSDNTAPTIQCPVNQTINAVGQQNANVTGLAPTNVTDNCAGNIALTYAPAGVGAGNGMGNANGTYPGGTSVVTYTATDAAGNTATCSFTVVVDLGSVFEMSIDTVAFNCGGASTISVPFRVENFADIAGMNFQVQWNPAVVSYTGFSNVFPGMGITGASFPSASTTAPQGFINFLSVSSSGQWPNIPNGGVIFNLNFTVLNPNATTTFAFAQPLNAINGSFAAAPFTFNNGYFSSVDNSGPVVTCPANVIAPGTANCSATVVLPSATATDACGTVASITNNAPAGNVYPAGPTVVTYTATDNSNNTSTCSTTVTVSANTALQFSNCPTAPIVIDAIANCSAPLAYPTLIPVNPCVTNANFTVNYNNPVGTIRPVGTTTVVATATQLGNGGGSVVCSFQVIIKDAGAPVLTCPADITIEASADECFVTNPSIPLATVTDNCDTGIIPTIDADLTDTLLVGENSLIYLATDAAGNVGACNFTITILDGEAPEIKCPNDVTVQATINCNAVATWAAPLIGDNCTALADLDLSGTAASGDVFSTGVNLVTYTVTDVSGNSAECTFSVNILEQAPPTISNCPNSQFILLPTNKCDTVATWIAPTAADNCGIDSFYTNILPGTVFQAGTTTVTYTAIDEAGNSVTCTFVIAALDAIAPVFTSFPNDMVINNADPCGAQLNIPEPIASDNCDPDPVITYSGSLQGLFPIGVTKIEFLVIDASGNTTKDTLTITVIPVEVPTFTNIPANQTIMACSSPATWVQPTLQGVCQPNTVTVTSNFQSGATFQIGTTTVIYTATDSMGGIITMTSFTITVEDPAPPVFNCPGNVVVNTAGVVIADPSNIVNFVTPENNCASVILNMDWPTATDDCDTDVSILEISGPPPAGPYQPGMFQLVFEAYDNGNNTSSCVVNVEVQSFAIGTPTVTPNPGCEGETVVLSVASYPGASYTWTGPQTSYPNAPTVTILSLTQGNTGAYSVSAALNGCTTTAGTVQVMMAVKPIAEDDINFTVGIGDTLKATSVLGNDQFVAASDIVITLQSQIEGLTFNLQDGTFTYVGTNPGSVSFIYEICSVACPDLCDMATVTIAVADTDCDFVPNVFTPNNDNINDLFEIPCLNSGKYPANTLVIYNQWGDQVFEAKGYENTPGKAWNGTLNNEGGKDLPDGVYYYIFKQDAATKALKGFVHIYR